jgi:hypothetical protein
MDGLLYKGFNVRQRSDRILQILLPAFTPSFESTSIFRNRLFRDYDIPLFANGHRIIAHSCQVTSQLLLSSMAFPNRRDAPAGSAR